jgi:hypothetical protein
MNKEDGIILIECNMTSPHGWKCNYCSNDDVRDDYKHLICKSLERELNKGFISLAIEKY